jgi:hypothetical protein
MVPRSGSNPNSATNKIKLIMKNRNEFLKENWKYAALMNIPSLILLAVFTSHAIESIMMRIHVVIFSYVILTGLTINTWYTDDCIRELQDEVKKLTKDKEFKDKFDLV